MVKAILRDAGLVLLGAVIGNALMSSAQTERQAFVKALEQPKQLFLEVGYSDNRFTPSPDGQWYQKDQDSSGRYKAGGGKLGLSLDVTPDLVVGADYVSLGRTRVDALAIAFPGDDRGKMTADIDPMRGPCSLTFKDGCLYQWHTAAHTVGANFYLSHRLFDLGEVRFDGKVGGYLHRLSSHAVVEPLGCRDNCDWRVTIDQQETKLTPMWGAVVRWKYAFFSWESFEGIGDHTKVIANVKGRVEVKTIGVRIPLS